MNYTKYMQIARSSKTQIQQGGLQSRFCGIILLIAAVVIGSAPARAELSLACGDMRGGFGPFDYTNPIHVGKNLSVVEAYHFTPKVENLISGEKGRVDPMDDIAYVIRAFPNHHRALHAMLRYHLQMESPPLPGARGSADCWFNYAINFKRDDGIVWMLYGIFLHRSGRLDEALERYNQALKFAPSSGDLHYNLGLLLFDLSNYTLSKKHAVKAYELGHPLPGLQKKLEKAGKWETSKSKTT